MTDRLADDGILILGHRNPDTDASVSAHAYASFLTRTERYDSPVTPEVTGPLGPQASYVFERAGVEHPMLVTDLRPQIRHVARPATDYLTTADRLRDAMTLLIRTGHSMLPILNSENRLQCVFSHRQDVMEATGSDSTVNHLPLPQDDPQQRRPDITKAGQLLNWEPTIDLKEGFQKRSPTTARNLAFPSTVGKTPSSPLQKKPAACASTCETPTV